MPVSRILNLALKGLSKYKTRTFLMMLGIIVGITTLTVIVSVGKGGRAKVMKAVKNVGTNAVMVFAGGGKVMGPPDEKVNTLTLEDAGAILQEVKGIKAMDAALVRLGRT